MPSRLDGPKLASRRWLYAKSRCGGREHVMRPPRPPEQNLRVLSGFSLPSTESPYPRPLDGSVTVAVLDLTENDDPIRVVETDDGFGVKVEWCIWGPLAADVAGCWTVR